MATISTRVLRRVQAPRAAVYQALLDPRAIARWKVPTGMTCQAHAFEAREGGSELTGAGKTTAHTGTCHGRFERLAPDEQVVDGVRERRRRDARPDVGGDHPHRCGGGHGGARRPRRRAPGVAPAANEAGWREALDRLAALVEAGRSQAGPEWIS